MLQQIVALGREADAVRTLRQLRHRGEDVGVLGQLEARRELLAVLLDLFRARIGDVRVTKKSGGTMDIVQVFARDTRAGIVSDIATDLGDLYRDYYAEIYAEPDPEMTNGLWDVSFKVYSRKTRQVDSEVFTLYWDPNTQSKAVGGGLR